MTDTPDEPDGPAGIAGGAQHTPTHPSWASGRPHAAPTPSNVQNLRLPGQPPPEAYQVALERLLAAMSMVCTINRAAVDPYRVAIQTAIAATHYADGGPVTEKILFGVLKRLDMHVATLPNAGPDRPGAA